MPRQTREKGFRPYNAGRAGAQPYHACEIDDVVVCQSRRSIGAEHRLEAYATLRRKAAKIRRVSDGFLPRSGLQDSARGFNRF
jgi:hypothetical protein